MNTSFIEKINKRKSTFPAPEEAIDKANACNLLSRDIYTDNTRFIYELLQNADDASCSNGSLIFQIDFVGDYLIISHAGKAFDQNDIESICSIGDGNKATDSEQTGFKGIGFKSVFAYSDLVIIKSGDYCFKFDKEESTNVWYANWGDKKEWQKERTAKNKSSKVSMPWQIIPINTRIPDAIPQKLLKPYNVSTIIRSKKISELRIAIDNLFKSAQLILFLRSRNVKIIVNGSQNLCVEKNIKNDITSISINGKVVSQWLIHTTEPFKVPSYIREKMEEDMDHYPEKLREATKASISFAVFIKNKKIERIEKNVNNIYSFLPTTVSLYDFPFIVNSNFITDAGRQNLHQDYVWNQWLFEEMPKHFILWIAEIAKGNRYGLDFLNVLERTSGSYDVLGRKYNRGMEEALSTIGILPNNDRMLMVKEAIFDRTELSLYIDKKSIIKFINKQENNFTNDSLLEEKYRLYYNRLKALGVYVWDVDELQNYLHDNSFQKNHKLEDNYNLINFLFERHQQLNKEDQERWNIILSETNFIFSDDKTLMSPEHLYFPTIVNGKKYSNIQIINKSVYNKLNSQLIEWLTVLGIEEVSDISFIEKTVLSDNYVNECNAIETLQYVFNLYSKGLLGESILRRLGSLNVLTQKGTLKIAKNCYLSDYYNPDVKIESLIDDDFFVSSNYCSKHELALQWKLFFIKIGVSDKIELGEKEYTLKEAQNTFHWAESFWKENKTQPNTFGGQVWNNLIDRYVLFIYSLFEHVTDYAFSCLFWNTILVDDFNRRGFRDKGHSSFGYQDKPHLNNNFFEWCIDNVPIIPTVQGRCELAKNVYSNSLPINTKQYLPVINVDTKISPEWMKLLRFKDSLELSDYLNILDAVSKENDKEDINENKSLIQDVYNAIAGQISKFHESKIDQIKQWGKKHKILAKDNSFYAPKDLSITLVEGFANKKFAFVGKDKPTPEIIQLMRILGVKVIEKVKPRYRGTKNENDEIKNQLRNVAPFIACIKGGDYDESLSKTLSRIESLSFIEVEQIELTYGDDTDIIRKTVYVDKKKVYYVGTWNKLRVLNSMAEPLAILMHIKSSNARMLEVLLVSDFDECIDYLEEFGYTINDQVKEEQKENKHVPSCKDDAIVGGRLTGGELATQDQINENNEAKKLVLAKLSLEGFNTSKVKDSTEYSIVNGVTLNGIEYPLVVKSCKNQEHRIWINPGEWKQLFKPNSMLWLHFGGGVVAPIKAFELFTYQDKLTLSFDSVNLINDKKVNKILEVFHYFNSVKLDLVTINPNTNRANDLNDYMFNDNNINNSDIEDKVSI